MFLANSRRDLLIISIIIFLMPTSWAETLPPGRQKIADKGQYPWSNKPHHISAEVCKECHQEIYQQWKSSIHAYSTALSDPIHEAFYRQVIGDPKAEGVTMKSGQYPVCLKCHAPNAALDKTTQLDALAVYDEGVSCINCHLFERFKGVKSADGKLNLGVDAYDIGSVLQGPSGKRFTQQPPPEYPLGVDSATPTYHPYPLAGNPTLLRTTAICLGCHEQRNNGKSVPLCMTGAEFKTTQNFNCQQCHMPVTNGYTDHSMAGGHVQAMLEQALVMTMTITPQAEDKLEAKITVHNTLPHNMPTGAPFRYMYLKLTAYNDKGEPIWHNSDTDLQSIFKLTLLNDAHEAVPPPKATQLGDDTRLKPYEKRILEYQLPVNEVAIVRAQLYYDLLWPHLKHQMTSIPESLKMSREIARVEHEI